MTQISELLILARKNANEHGWKIKWNNDDCKECISGKYKILSIGDSISLLHSELSEMLEAYRDNNMENFKEEVADEFIRLFHLCGDLDINIEDEINKKMEKNRTRPHNHGRKNY